jgi:integrase
LPKIPDYVCDLPGGQTARFSLKKRADSPFYFVCFRDSSNQRRELTTGARAKHKAIELAPGVVRDNFTVEAVKEALSWDDAVLQMVQHMTAQNLRPATIDQYRYAISNLRKAFPKSAGPADITPAMAERFKLIRMGGGKVTPRTVEGNLGNLAIIYGRWFQGVLRIVEGNPFADVDAPKHDKPAPRLVVPEELAAFVAWLDKRWHWRLPLLFLETKASIGCRISELASATIDGLADGRICFEAQTAKGRKQRTCLLPPLLFDELKAGAGPRYVFERFAEELRAIHRGRGQAKAVKDYTPRQLVKWLQAEAQGYFDKTGAKKFKLHNLRGTAMSKARMAGVAESDAAIAFGCNPETMRKHYLALDEAQISDRVFSLLRGY